MGFCSAGRCNIILAAVDLANLLGTGLTRRQVEVCIELLNSGIEADALVAAVNRLKAEAAQQVNQQQVVSTTYRLCNPWIILTLRIKYLPCRLAIPPSREILTKKTSAEIAD